MHVLGTYWARTGHVPRYVPSTCTQWARNRHVVRYVLVPRNSLCYVHVIDLVQVPNDVRAPRSSGMEWGARARVHALSPASGPGRRTSHLTEDGPDQR